MNCFAAAAFCLVTGDETDTSVPESMPPTRSGFKLRAPSLIVPSPPSISPTTNPIKSTPRSHKARSKPQSVKHFSDEMKKLRLQEFEERSGEPSVCENDRVRVQAKGYSEVCTGICVVYVNKISIYMLGWII